MLAGCPSTGYQSYCGESGGPGQALFAETGGILGSCAGQSLTPSPVSWGLQHAARSALGLTAPGLCRGCRMCTSLRLSPGGPKPAGLPGEWCLVGLPSSKVSISGERVFAPFSGESLFCLERGLGSARAQRHWPGGPLSPLCCSSSRHTVSPPVGDSEITGRILTGRAWGDRRLAFWRSALSTSPKTLSCCQSSQGCGLLGPDRRAAPGHRGQAGWTAGRGGFELHSEQLSFWGFGEGRAVTNSEVTRSSDLTPFPPESPTWTPSLVIVQVSALLSLPIQYSDGFDRGPCSLRVG